MIDAAEPVSDLSAADAVRLVANTAVLARVANPAIEVSSVKRNGTPGVLVWMPGWLWDGKQIVATSGNSSGNDTPAVATSGK